LALHLDLQLLNDGLGHGDVNSLWKSHRTNTLPYPLARRNQPQWLEIANFLSTGLPLNPRSAAAAAGKRSAAAAAARSIPDGNHGDNLRSDVL
jgi:hypothetical protein